jgi:hypothetical protein
LIGSVHIGTDQNLYVNLNFFLASYIPLLLILPHKFSAFKTLNLAKKKGNETKIGRKGNVAPFGIIRIQINFHMSAPVVNLPTYPISACLPI